MAPKTLDLVPGRTLSCESTYSIDVQPPNHLGGVLLSEALAEDIYSPINRHVPGLGEVVRMDEPPFEAVKDPDNERNERWWKVNLNGFGYGVHETRPVGDVAPGITFVHIPGFTELIEVGSARDLHDSLANTLPDARVISIASDGIGPTGEHLHLDNFKDHTVKIMGEERAQLIEALVGEDPTIVSACSMGSVISCEMLNFDAQHGHNLNAVPINYASAVVTPEKAFLIMAVLFPLHMSGDIPRAIIHSALKYGAHHMQNMAHMLEDRGPDILAMSVQVASLMGGVALSSVERVSATYPGGGNISGRYDPLAQWRMWTDLRAGGHSPHLRSIKRSGHGLAADGTGGGVQIAKSADRWGLKDKLAA